MPRVGRNLVDNQIYHIINRGNRRETVFHDKNDYNRFLKLLIDSKERYKIKFYAYCLMPNHFHLVIHTEIAENLSNAMHWISSSYVRYYNKKYSVSGHLWQGRYKSFIVQEDTYLLILLKYVEANPLRANIVDDCIKYTYSSAKNRILEISDELISTPPILLPINWHSFINEKENKIDIETINNSIDRQTPLGDENWQYMICKKHGLVSTLNPVGRPKKEN